jgi:hypothetical protein
VKKVQKLLLHIEGNKEQGKIAGGAVHTVCTLITYAAKSASGNISTALSIYILLFPAKKELVNAGSVCKTVNIKIESEFC